MINKIKYICVVIITTATVGCSSKVKISSNPVINEIVKDYYKGNRRYIKNYSVFHIRRKEMKNQKVEVYNILPENDEISYIVNIEDSLNSDFPTNYLEYKNKLFLWQEKDKKISDSVMKYLYNRKLVDSSYAKYQLGLISGEDIIPYRMVIDENLKGTNYVFCKSNPTKIKKKIISSKYINPDDKRLQVKCD